MSDTNTMLMSYKGAPRLTEAPSTFPRWKAAVKNYLQMNDSISAVVGRISNPTE